MLRIIGISITVVMAGAALAVTYEELVAQIMRSRSVTEIYCSDFDIDFPGGYDSCAVFEHSVIQKMRDVERLILAAGGCSIQDWSYTTTAGANYWFAGFQLGDRAFTVSMIEMSQRYTILWLSRFYGSFDNACPTNEPAATDRAPGPAGVGQVITNAARGEVRYFHEGTRRMVVVAVPSATTVDLSEGNRREVINLGFVALLPDVPAEEARRTLNRMLLGQTVFLVDADEGTLVFYRDPGGLWSVDDVRMTLANAQIVREGLLAPLMPEGELSGILDDVKSAMETINE